MVPHPAPVHTARRAIPAAVFLVVLGLLGAPLGAGMGERLDGPVPARVVEVVDGDTLLVRARIWLGQEVETRVRLLGIDAPELKGRCAHERSLAEAAREFVRARLGDGAVVLHDVSYGKYAGRVLARIEARGGEDLGRSLLGAGLARAYDGGRRDSWCAATVQRTESGE